jgi:hypothetical protein
MHPSDLTNPGCADFLTMAEQELSAFFRAVTELFGSEQARLSAEDWLEELTADRGLPSSMRECRRITARASAQLADRVCATHVFATQSL